MTRMSSSAPFTHPTARWPLGVRRPGGQGKADPYGSGQGARCQRLTPWAAIVKRRWLVAIVVAIMVMTVVAIALTIPISPIAVVIPMMVVFDPAALSFPVAVVEESTLVARRDPNCPFVWRTAPVPVVPFVALPVGIPIAFDPKIAGPRRYRPDCDDARRGGWPNANSDRDIRSQKGSCGQHKSREQIRFLHCNCILILHGIRQ